MAKRTIAWALVGACLVGPTAALAEENEPDKGDAPGVWRIGVGATYSEGNYEALDDTKVVAVPVSIKYKRGGFSVRVAVPYVHVEGPGTLLDTPQGSDAGFGGGGGGGSGDDGGSDSGSGSSGSGSSGSGSSGSGSSGSGSSGSGPGPSGSGVDDSGGLTGGDVVPTPTPTPAPGVARGGLGDVSVTLGYSLPLGDRTYFDLTGRIKLPTASAEKRIGTGKTDLVIGGDLTQDLGPFSLYTGARYRFIGEPDGANLRNTFGAGAGASYRLAGGTFVGANFDWQESVVPGRRASGEVTGWVNFGLTPKIRSQVFVSTGINSVSTDFAAGLSLSARLN